MADPQNTDDRIRRLFDDEDGWTDEATALAVQFDDLIRPFVTGAVARGVSVRDLELIMSFGISMTCAATLQERSIQRRRGWRPSRTEK
jgi:hypothetical protein